MNGRRINMYKVKVNLDTFYIKEKSKSLQYKDNFIYIFHQMVLCH